MEVKMVKLDRLDFRFVFVIVRLCDFGVVVLFFRVSFLRY